MILKRYESKDLLAVYQIVQEAGDNLFLNLPMITPENVIESLLQNSSGFSILLCIFNPDLVGLISLNNINHLKGSAFIGNIAIKKGTKGLLGVKASKWVINYCFQGLNLNRVYGHTGADNPKMDAFYKRLGAVHEGTEREHSWKNGKYVDLKIWESYGGNGMATILPASNTSIQFQQKLASSINDALGQYFAQQRQDQLIENDRKFKLELLKENLKADKELSRYRETLQTEGMVDRLKQTETFSDTKEKEDAGFIVNLNTQEQWKSANKGAINKPGITSTTKQQGDGTVNQLQEPKNINILENLKDENGKTISFSSTYEEDRAIAMQRGYVPYQDDEKSTPRWVTKEEANRLESQKNTNSMITQRKAQTEALYYELKEAKIKGEELKKAKDAKDKIAQADVFRAVYNEDPTAKPEKFAAFQESWDKPVSKGGPTRKEIYQYMAANDAEKDPRKLYESVFLPKRGTKEDLLASYMSDTGEAKAMTVDEQQKVVSNSLWIRDKMKAEILRSGDTSYIDNIDNAIIQAVQMQQIADAYPTEMTRTGGLQDTKFGNDVFVTAMAIARSQYVPEKERNSLSAENKNTVTPVWRQLEKEGMVGAQNARERAIAFAATRKALVNLYTMDLASAGVFVDPGDPTRIYSAQVFPDVTAINQLASHLTDGDETLVKEMAKGDAQFYKDVIARANYITEKLKVSKAANQKGTRDMAAEQYGWSGIRSLVTTDVATGQPKSGPSFTSAVTNTYPQHFGKYINPDMPVEDQQADRVLLGEVIERYKMQYGQSIPPEKLRADIGRFLPSANVDYLINEYERTYKK